MKLPEGLQYGFLFNIASGKQLDVFGKYEGIPRKRWFIFKESDRKYKKRIVKAALAKRGLTGNETSMEASICNT